MLLYEIYGQWLVLTAIPSFLAMSNLGLGTAAQISIAMDLSGGKKDSVIKIMLTAITMIVGIGLIISLAIFTLVPFFYQYDFSDASISSPQLILLFLVLVLFIKMLAQPMAGLWTGIGRPSVPSHAGNICAFIELAVSIAVPLAGGDPMRLVSSLLVINVAWIIIYTIRTIPIIRDLKLKFSLPDWRMGKQMIFTGLGHQVGPLWQSILFQGSIIVANSVMGPAGAAAWGSLRLLTRCGNQLLELVSQTLGPEFQLAAGKQDNLQLRKLYSMGLIMSIVMSSCTTCGLLIAGPTIYKIWAPGLLPVPIGVWIIMASGLIPFSFWWLAGEFQRATNKPWLLNLWGVIAAGISVGIMYYLGFLGLTAFAIGSLVFDVLMSLTIFPMTLKSINTSPFIILKEGIIEFKNRLYFVYSKFKFSRSKS
jgi:O-antigen/teichoic acid export membrane protein